jgi:hypothetical protein
MKANVRLSRSWKSVAAVPFVFALVLVVTATESRAEPSTVPMNLDVGDEYRLAFLTSTTRDAISADLADYNAFVSATANAIPELLALSTTWKALASTDLIAARDNSGTDPGAATGVPIYLLNDTLLASNNADLWDGTISEELDVDESGASTEEPLSVWTGSDSSGAGPFFSELGSTSTMTIAGATNQVGEGWILNTVTDFEAEKHLYAISDVLTVPTAVPALTGWATLALVGSLTTLATRILRRN